ncbi:MAG: DUF1015 family protein [Saprospiraceae bacterium]|nr:DUF1015 family protein [Saprospiraceae bacterium]
MQVLAFEGVFPNMDFITSPDTFFQTVREDYPTYYESGFFKPSGGREAILLYRIVTPLRLFTGVVACAAVTDYLSDKIKRHEHTLADKEQVQTQLLLHRRAAVKPVLLTYPNAGAVDQWIQDFTVAHAPFSEIWFEQEQQRHLFWRVDNEFEITNYKSCSANLCLSLTWLTVITAPPLLPCCTNACTATPMHTTIILSAPGFRPATSISWNTTALSIASIRSDPPNLWRTCPIFAISNPWQKLKNPEPNTK